MILQYVYFHLQEGIHTMPVKSSNRTVWQALSSYHNQHQKDQALTSSSIVNTYLDQKFLYASQLMPLLPTGDFAKFLLRNASSKTLQHS